MVNSEIKVITIDKLEVDEFNMRRGDRAYDDDFKRSIEEEGVKTRPLVRPLPSGFWKDWNGKYGVVYGAQRYYAAVETGKREIECEVREMSDAEVVRESIKENVQRTPHRRWQLVQPVRNMFELFTQQRMLPEKAIDRIAEELVWSRAKVKKYLAVSYLPQVIKILCKEHDYRDKQDKTVLKSYGFGDTKAYLKIEQAKLLAMDLGDLPPSCLIEIAKYILHKSVSLSKKVVQLIKENPKISFPELDEKLFGTGKCYVHTTVDPDLREKLENECIKRKKKMPELIAWILNEFLEKWIIYYRRNFLKN